MPVNYSNDTQWQNHFNKLVPRNGTGSLKESLTPQNVKDAGLISYWGAEFEFPTCPAFSNGVSQCAQRGIYPFTLQNNEYNQKVMWWMQEMRQWSVLEDWILPTHGTIFALATAIRLLVKKGQKIIVMPPTYNRYAQAANRMGRDVLSVPLIYNNGTYEIDFSALKKAMAAPENTLLVLCNPNNPTGNVWDKQTLECIAQLSQKTKTVVFSDEIFAEVSLYGNKVVAYGSVQQEDGLSITCTSLGKCMSLTGVNHANVFIPNKALRNDYNNQRYADHYGSIDPMLYAGLCNAYTQEGKSFVQAMCTVIEKNVQILKKTLAECLPKAKLILPQGTFVAWVDYTQLGMSDSELEQFFEKAFFHGDKGQEYGSSGQFYRYNLSVPPKELMRSMKILKQTAIDL